MARYGTWTLYADGDPMPICADNEQAAIDAAVALWTRQLWPVPLTVVRDEDGEVVWKDGITL